MTERFGPFMEYLSKELGVPVKLRIAADYAAVIEGQRGGTIISVITAPLLRARSYCFQWWC